MTLVFNKTIKFIRASEDTSMVGRNLLKTIFFLKQRLPRHPRDQRRLDTATLQYWQFSYFLTLSEYYYTLQL